MRVTIFAALLLTGCVTPIVDYKAMAPEQIKELVRDKAMAGNCIVLNTPYGRGVTTNIAIDKSVVAAGGTFTVDEQCKMTFQQGQQGGTSTFQIVPVQPAPQPVPPAAVPSVPVPIRPQSSPLPSSRLRDVLETSAQMQR